MSEPTLRSVTIALDTLEAFFADTEITLTELAKRVGVAKSTMHRTCGVLVRRGLLERTPEGTYRLGVRLYEFGHLVTTRSTLRAEALPLLVDLRNAIGETVQLGVPSGGDVLYIERVEGLRELRFTTEAGRAPVHRSSAGKVIAAFRPEVAASRLAGGLRPFTGHTIVVPALFLEELQHVRERGYAVSVDEGEIGLSSIGVPVRECLGGAVIAAISTAGPTTRVLAGNEQRHVAILLKAAERLTVALASGDYRLGSPSRTQATRPRRPT